MFVTIASRICWRLSIHRLRYGWIGGYSPRYGGLPRWWCYVPSYRGGCAAIYHAVVVPDGELMSVGETTALDTQNYY